MDALSLLQEVAAAYRNLETLAVEASFATGSGDEGNNQERERRATFLYATPNHVRYETHEGAFLEVFDGRKRRMLHSFHPPNGRPTYTETPVDPAPVPHSFAPELPYLGDCILFARIADCVAGAEMIREENGCFVVSVTYESRNFSEMMTPTSPPLFWIDAQTRMVMRYESEVSISLPTPLRPNGGPPFPLERATPSLMRSTMTTHSIRINEPVPSDAFQLTVPDNAIIENPAPMGRGHVSSSSTSYSLGARSLGCSDSHEWDGETVVQHSQIRVHGKILIFERRITFTEDYASLHVEERVSSGTAHTQCDCDLLLE
jgi:outer membrane lipoprotein-sorting protein